MKTEYDTQAETFLAANGLKIRITLSDTKTPTWSPAGHHYRVTLVRHGHLVWVHMPKRITFDFWGSVADAEKNVDPSPYSVLACISSDAHTPETFKDWCDEYGDDLDSLKALQTFRRCNTFAKRLRAFFTPAELDQLSEIQ